MGVTGNKNTIILLWNAVYYLNILCVMLSVATELNSALPIQIFYDAGVTKHPETKAYIICALIALAYKKCEGTRRDELLEIAKKVDDMQKVTDTDINILLDELNDKGFVY